MDDLIERLRHEAFGTGYKPSKPLDLLVEAADEIERLRAQVSNQLADLVLLDGQLLEARAELAAMESVAVELRAELEECRQKAKRYEWLRDKAFSSTEIRATKQIGHTEKTVWHVATEDIDAAIDAALAAQEQK
jgi:hypothetical protein